MTMHEEDWKRVKKEMGPKVKELSRIPTKYIAWHGKGKSRKLMQRVKVVLSNGRTDYVWVKVPDLP